MDTVHIKKNPGLLSHWQLFTCLEFLIYLKNTVYASALCFPLSLLGSVPETHTKSVLSDPYAPFYFDNYINPVRPTELQVDVNGYVILSSNIYNTHVTYNCFQFDQKISLLCSMVLILEMLFPPLTDGNNTSMTTIQMLPSNKQPAISPRWSSVLVTLKSVPPRPPTPSAETKSSRPLRGLNCPHLQVLIDWSTHQTRQHFRKLISISNKGAHHQSKN